MELILAPKPKRSKLYNKFNREFPKPMELNQNKPFEIDISPISSFIKINESSKILNKSNNSLFYSSSYAFESLITDFEQRTKNYEAEVTTEIIGILSKPYTTSKNETKTFEFNEFNNDTSRKMKQATNINIKRTNFNYVQRPHFQNKGMRCTRKTLLDNLRKNSCQKEDN